MDTNYLIILALLIGCLASTIPVFMALFFTGMVGLVWIAGIDAQIVVEVLYRSMDKFALIVVLFFVLCGNIMTTEQRRCHFCSEELMNWSIRTWAPLTKSPNCASQITRVFGIEVA